MHSVLVHGAEIPALGFGTFQLGEGDAAGAVSAALAAGYRHIDTAQAYENEEQVGAAIAASGLRRQEIFLTTKVWVDRFRKGDLEASAKESLQRLKVEQVDLLLLHWPSREVPLAETIEALNAAKDQGLTRHIGISNFTTAQIEEATRPSKHPLAVNQVEYHPFLDQRKVLAKLVEKGMGLTAYSPLARGLVPKDPTLAEIGRKHGKSPSQVALRWLVQQKNVIAIPKASSPERIAENLAIFDFTLSAAEMERIATLARPDGRQIDPESLRPDWD